MWIEGLQSRNYIRIRYKAFSTVYSIVWRDFVWGIFLISQVIGSQRGLQSQCTTTIREVRITRPLTKTSRIPLFRLRDQADLKEKKLAFTPLLRQIKRKDTTNLWEPAPTSEHRVQSFQPTMMGRCREGGIATPRHPC